MIDAFQMVSGLFAPILPFYYLVLFPGGIPYHSIGSGYSSLFTHQNLVLFISASTPYHDTPTVYLRPAHSYRSSVVGVLRFFLQRFLRIQLGRCPRPRNIRNP
jgi:hypothetical protein